MSETPNMSGARQSSKRFWRTAVALVAVVTVIAGSIGYNADPCYDTFAPLRAALWIMPLLLIGTLVGLAMATTSERREPLLAIGAALLLATLYLPYTLLVLLWDTGCPTL